MEEKRKKNRGFLKMLLIMLLLAVAILAVAVAVRAKQEGGLRALWRSIRGVEKTDEFFFENVSGGAAADMELGLAVAADSGLYVYDETGNQIFSCLYSWQEPALAVDGGYGAAWNIGGGTVIFFDRKGVIKEIPEENPIVSATVNSLGYLAVSAEADGYKGVVTVYNSLGTAIYRWSAGSDRVLSARVSGRDELVVLTVGKGGSRFVKLRLDSEELQSEYTYPGLVIDFAFTDSGITAVSTGALIGLSGQLQERWTYDYGGRFLEHYCIDGGLCAVALADYQVGGGRTVETVSDGGEVRGTLALSNDPVDMDVSGGSVAVLTSDSVAVYSDALEEVSRYECGFGAGHTDIRADGTVLCAGTFSAYVYGKM